MPQRRPRAAWSRRRRSTRRPRAARRRPRGRVAPSSEAAASAAVAAVGSPCRLALVAAIGPGRARRRRARGRGRAPAARWCARARRGAASTPVRRGRTSVSGPGQNRVGHPADARRPARRARAPASAVAHSTAIGTSARRPFSANSRSTALATSAARPARRRCRSAARPHHRAQHRHDLVDLRGSRPSAATLPTPTPRLWPRSDATATQAARSPLRPVPQCRSDRGRDRGRQRRATRARSRPARSGSTRASAKPAASASATDGVALGLADLDDERCRRGASQSRRSGDDHLDGLEAGGAGHERAAPAPSRRPRRAAGRSAAT